MIVSYKLLQTYFTKKLPTPDAIADALTFHAFEIEGMEAKDGDTIIDVKVLPNRAHDCLSHRGVAREVAAIMGIPLKNILESKLPKAHRGIRTITVDIKDKRVLRYMSLVIDGVAVGPSPAWLIDALNSLGQRSINNIVDATNYTMFMLGQPIHAFDLAKVSGSGIVVRPAKDGEMMTTLDKKEVTLDPEVMVIADKEGVLGIAGVKGGVKAEVDAVTTAIVIESANFDASTIRKTAMMLGIRTDASKRFESGLTPVLAEEALNMVAGLIVVVAGGKKTRVGAVLDKFPKQPKPTVLTVSLREIDHILGAAFTSDDVERVWKRLGFAFQISGKGVEAVYTVTAPPERLDIVRREDLAEEVGRMIGYHKLAATMPEEVTLLPEQNKEWHCRDIIRTVMLGVGYSEVYTYSFVSKGEIEVANPIAADKKYLRNNLLNGLTLALAENLKYESEVRIFEFGHIFNKKAGKLHEGHAFAGILGFTKRKEAQMKEDFFALKGALQAVFAALGIKGIRYEEADGELVASVLAGDIALGIMSINGFELDLKKMVELSDLETIYKTPSRYPSINRDVSLFVPVKTPAGAVEEIIRKSAGPLMQDLALFDVFEQPDKKSLAFRMVLQSFEKTLSDEEANDVYNRVVKTLQKANSKWQVRV
jgi:phenylalanyl-tRNA synthetase beta chain